MSTITEPRPMVASTVADLHGVSLGQTSVLSDEIDAAVRRILLEVSLGAPTEPTLFQSSI